MRAHLLWPLLLLAGCAWDAGEGFAVIEPSVRASYEPEEDREVFPGFQQLASNYQVRPSAAMITLQGIELIPRRVSAGGGGRFDPSNPPPGYSLCHGGHCHRDDGALIPYEEIEAELGGGGGVTRPLITLPVGDVNLFNRDPISVPCQPTCELPRTELSTGRWAITMLRLQGVVRDGLATPRIAGEQSFKLELASPPGGTPIAVLEGDLDVPSDRENEPRVKLVLKLEVPSRIFDAVDWAAARPGADGILDLSTAQNADARADILEGLEAVRPTAEVQREQR
jgi:hypothetical protein